MPVLKTIRKINACKKEDVYFQGFWPLAHNIWRAGLFRIATFSEHLLPTASEYPMFLPLTKIKSQNINVIGVEICIKSKIYELISKTLNCFANESCSFHKLYVLKCKFKAFPLFFSFSSF